MLISVIFEIMEVTRQSDLPINEIESFHPCQFIFFQVLRSIICKATKVTK